MTFISFAEGGLAVNDFAVAVTPSQFELMYGLIDKLTDRREDYIPGQDAGVPTEVEQSVNKLADSVAAPTGAGDRQGNDLVKSLVQMLKDIILLEYDHKDLKSSTEVRSKIFDLMARIVQTITDSDCVLVRRLHTDGTAELIEAPFFARRGSEKTRFGRRR